MALTLGLLDRGRSPSLALAAFFPSESEAPPDMDLRRSTGTYVDVLNQDRDGWISRVRVLAWGVVAMVHWSTGNLQSRPAERSITRLKQLLEAPLSAVFQRISWAHGLYAYPCCVFGNLMGDPRDVACKLHIMESVVLSCTLNHSARFVPMPYIMQIERLPHVSDLGSQPKCASV